MASRRSYGIGSLVERPEGSGKWYFRYSAGNDPVTGNTIRRSATIEARTKTAARSKATALLAEIEETEIGTNATLHQVLVEWRVARVQNRTLIDTVEDKLACATRVNSEPKYRIAALDQVPVERPQFPRRLDLELPPVTRERLAARVH